VLEPKKWHGTWKWTCVLAILIAVTVAVAAEANEPKRIVVLHSYGQDFSPFSEFANSFRSEMDRQFKEPVDVYEFSLATARFADENLDRPFAEYLRALFHDHRLDLVVTIGAPAADFFSKYRQQISPASPMLITFLEQRRVLALTNLAANDAVVSNKIDFSKLMDNILRVLPKTNNIVMVLGDTRLERFWVKQLQETLQPYTKKVTFTWLNNLAFEDMLKRAAVLPPRSAIFFVLLSVDAAGVPHPLSGAFDRLRAVANAPMFSFVDAYFGRGLVGGPMLSLLEFSRRAASVAVRILNGEIPGEIKIESLGFEPPKYDSRELRRWNIKEADLPPGSVIEYRAPTTFEQYGRYIVAGVAISFIEAIAIVGLLISRRRLDRERVVRQRAESVARDFSERLIGAQENERSRLARELHDDVTQRLAALAIEAGRAQGREPDNGARVKMGEIRDGLIKVSEDVHALSYRLHPSILDDLGLVEALRAECERFSKLESIPVDLKIEEGFISPMKQIALCLFRIAQEALQNVGRHAKASQAEVSLQRLENGFRICVRDNGIGFDPKQHRDRPSLGLASMQQRIYLVGGELDIDSAPGHGTIVLAWVPMEEKPDEPRAGVAG
jgi:signal transduction histidine kinase